MQNFGHEYDIIWPEEEGHMMKKSASKKSVKKAAKKTTKKPTKKAPAKRGPGPGH